MLPSYGAVCGTFALRKLRLHLTRYIVTFELFLVAILTEVGGLPAEPLRNRAAELTLEFYVVGAMFCTVDNACPDAHGGAFTANEILRLEFLILQVWRRYVVTKSTKVK
jgi:hypothetical protein